MDRVASDSVQLVVTSPPYPMVEMWDKQFISQDPKIESCINRCNGSKAFERMHCILDTVWDEVYRILAPGCFACINIGDATRKIGDDFQLYHNHARILQKMTALGFSPMPAIIWRKQTNAPNKFMGSGMLPAGAYVTLEHEYVLILRKGPKRVFPTEPDKQLRRESALFWEERNQWFSDVWFDLKGTVQKMTREKTRDRSGAFPFALPYRLITMFSVKGDTVVDPFLGTGTTTLAAMAAARNSVGIEIEHDFLTSIRLRMKTAVPDLNRVIAERLKAHINFIEDRKKAMKPLKYKNGVYGFDVVTNQEKYLVLNGIYDIQYFSEKQQFAVSHSPKADPAPVSEQLLF